MAHAGGTLHSTRDPLREADRFAENLAREIRASSSDSSSDGSILLIVGIGWGYHIAPILQALPNHKIIFFEPVVEVREALRPERLGELRSSGARIAESLEEIRAAMGASASSPPAGALELRILPAYQRLFPELAGDLTRRLEQMLAGGSGSRTDVDQATTGRFMRQWARNFFINLRENECLDFLGAHVRFSLPPAPSAVLYCGAGPELLTTLEPHLDLLRNERRGIAVLAADSALAPLLHVGIRPDLVLSVDSGRGTAYHYQAAARVAANMDAADGDDGGSAPRFPFPVLSWTAGPRFARRWFKRVFYYRSTFPFDQILGSDSDRPLGGIAQWENPSRNPAGLALLLADWLRVRRVYLAGADFRARGDVSHERGTGYTLFGLEDVHRLRSLEMYRPGGYGKTARGKNRQAQDGLAKLAWELELKMNTLRRDTPLPRRDAHTDAVQFEGMPVRTQEARENLKESWNRLDFSSLPGQPDAEQIKKWRRLLH